MCVYVNDMHNIIHIDPNRYWGHKLRSNELVKFYGIVPEVRSLVLRTTYQLQREIHF